MPFVFTMPKLSPTMEIGTIVKWHKKEGEPVQPGELLLEVATDKATVEHQALDKGWLKKIVVSEGEEAVVNQPIAIFTESKEESIEGFSLPSAPSPAPVEASVSAVAETPASAAPPSPLAQPAFVPQPPLENYEFAFPVGAPPERIKASPLARRIAEEQGLDLTTVKGSGPGGRIVQADLHKAQKNGAVAFGRRESPEIPPGTYAEEKLTPMRKIICQRMQEAKSFIPHFYVSQAIDAELLVQIREQLSRTGIKVSLNDLVIRACALSLREHPVINSGFNSAAQSLIRFKTIDISVAVTLPEGLITPIIRHADYKNVGQISNEMRALAERAKEGKLSPEEYQGGSFTLSNLGMYGITDFQAILNPPQAAILAVGGIHNVPVVKNGNVVPGKVMHATVSADHRVIDGVAAAQFMKTLQKYLENPAGLLI